MINRELLAILVCPDNKMPLELADAALLEQLNQSIRAGQITNRAGQKVESVVDEGLVRKDRAVLYAVNDGIPVMLVDEAIPLDQLFTGNTPSA